MVVLGKELEGLPLNPREERHATKNDKKKVSGMLRHRAAAAEISGELTRRQINTHARVNRLEKDLKMRSTHTHTNKWMSPNGKAPLCSENPDARAHKKCTRADSEPIGEPLSHPHYVRAESLECIAVDSDRMIRGFLEDGDLDEPAGQSVCSRVESRT